MKCGRDPSDRVRSLKREVEALYQNNVRPGANRKLDTEVFQKNVWASAEMVDATVVVFRLSCQQIDVTSTYTK